MTTYGTSPSSRLAVAEQVAVGFARKQDFYLAPQEDVVLNAAKKSETDFKKHEKIWKRETQFFSSPADKYLHPSYARIIGIGHPAVALILKSMRREPADWFYALRAITGANPITQAIAGDVRKMSEAWIKWGERQGLL
jgi:hypothetical protein